MTHTALIPSPLLRTVISLPLVLATFAIELAAGPVRRWEIEATVTQIEDPDQFYPDVQLGDPVRGFLSYDLRMPAEVDPLEGVFFLHSESFQTNQMAIENPRTDEELEFQRDPLGISAVGITYDSETDEETLTAFELVIPPEDLPPWLLWSVSVILTAPPGHTLGQSLPESLDLNDWPLAAIVVSDFDFVTFIAAEIYSLTPVEVALTPGDYNYDATVDGADFLEWQRHAGSSSGMWADGNLDGAVDAGDLATWTTNLSPVTTPSTIVPEPTAAEIAVALAVLSSSRSLVRRRRGRQASFSCRYAGVHSSPPLS